MLTTNEYKAYLEHETGLKISISKNKGSMKHHITFRPRMKQCFKHDQLNKLTENFHWSACYKTVDQIDVHIKYFSVEV